MTADGKQEYVFTAELRRYLVGGAVALPVLVALAVFGVLVFDRSLDRYVVPALVVVAAFSWTIARNLVLSATLQDGRLRARTLLARHEIAIADITSLDWNVTEGLAHRLAAAAPDR